MKEIINYINDFINENKYNDLYSDLTYDGDFNDNMCNISIDHHFVINPETEYIRLLDIFSWAYDSLRIYMTVCNGHEDEVIGLLKLLVKTIK